MKRQEIRRGVFSALLLSAAIFSSGCTSHQASECSFPQQLGAVFVQSLQFSHRALDRMADDAAGCNR